jgi:hypothetical protein
MMIDLTLLMTIRVQLYRIGGPIIMALGTISCLLSLLVFGQKHLRKNSCSIYFIAVNISNIGFIYSLVLLFTLSNGYNSLADTYSIHACRLSIYVTFLSEILSSSFLILASIDRFLFTSSNALTRQKSSVRNAYYCLAATTFFWSIFHVHAFIYAEIRKMGDGTMVCAFQTGSYTTFVGSYLLIVKGIVIPLLMAVFGIWTVHNVRAVQLRRIGPTLSNSNSTTANGSSSMSTKDRQLIMMLLINITIYVLCTLPFSIVIFYQQAMSSTDSSLENQLFQQFIRLVTLFISYVPHCVDFYENLLVSKTFRGEIKRLINCK